MTVYLKKLGIFLAVSVAVFVVLSLLISSRCHQCLLYDAF